MAAIIHRCACGHPADFHLRTLKGDTVPCRMHRCGCGDVEPQQPEVIPTWRSDTPTGTAMPDPVLLQPGTVDLPNGIGRLCDCEDCQALYRRETAGAAA